MRLTSIAGCHVTSLTTDDIRPDRPRHDSETRALTFTLSFGRLASSSSPASDDLRGWYHRDTVLLIRVSEDLFHGDRIAVPLQKFI